MSTILISTTQNIELEYPLASLGDRIIGTFIDLMAQLGYILLMVSLLYWLKIENLSTIGLIFLLPVGLYHPICEIFFNGQSLGKALMRTQVVRLDGSPPSLSNFLLRWLLRPVDIMVLNGLVALISIAVTQNSQRLGDLAAGTTVVKLKLVVNFWDSIFLETEADYIVQYPQVKNLSDKDLSILKEVLDVGVRNANPELLEKLATRVLEVTGATTIQTPRAFLETVLKDYNHLYGGKN